MGASETKTTLSPCTFVVPTRASRARRRGSGGGPGASRAPGSCSRASAGRAPPRASACAAIIPFGAESSMSPRLSPQDASSYEYESSYAAWSDGWEPASPRRAALSDAAEPRAFCAPRSPRAMMMSMVLQSVTSRSPMLSTRRGNRPQLGGGLLRIEEGLRHELLILFVVGSRRRAQQVELRPVGSPSRLFVVGSRRIGVISLLRVRGGLRPVGVLRLFVVGGRRGIGVISLLRFHGGLRPGLLILFVVGSRLGLGGISLLRIHGGRPPPPSRSSSSEAASGLDATFFESTEGTDPSPFTSSSSEAASGLVPTFLEGEGDLLRSRFSMRRRRWRRPPREFRFALGFRGC